MNKEYMYLIVGSVLISIGISGMVASFFIHDYDYNSYYIWRTTDSVIGHRYWNGLMLSNTNFTTNMTGYKPCRILANITVVYFNISGTEPIPITPEVNLTIIAPSPFNVIYSQSNFIHNFTISDLLDLSGHEEVMPEGEYKFILTNNMPQSIILFGDIYMQIKSYVNIMPFPPIWSLSARVFYLSLFALSFGIVFSIAGFKKR